MFKMMSSLMVILMVIGVTWPTFGGVTFDLRTDYNSAGDTIGIISATSDGAPITSLGVHIWAIRGGQLGQVHPAGMPTIFQNNNNFFPFTGNNVDEDTQVLFVNDSSVLIVGGIDTTEEFEVNFTGFEPFQSRDIAQVVVTSGWCDCEISAVAGGEVFTSSPIMCNPPEPASLGLLAAGAVALMRRR